VRTAIVLLFILTPVPWTGWRLPTPNILRPASQVMAGYGRPHLTFPEEESPSAGDVFAVMGLAIMGGAAWLQHQRPGPALDIENALFSLLALLLSPVTWDHYRSCLYSRYL
jgi:hypothetical protein